MEILSSNKKAYFDYDVLDKIEAGISLFGWEVKSIKNGSMSLAGSYIIFKNGEVFLTGSYVPSWKFSPKVSKEIEQRERKLLLNKSEINNLENKAKQSGNSVVPLEVYKNNGGIIKVQIGLVKGKKKFDKRKKLKERDLKRRVDTERKEYNF